LTKRIKKRKEEEPVEEEEEDEDGVKKNKDEVRLDHMADFQIYDCCQFSMKVMQGEPIRALQVVPQHEKKTPFQKQEELNLLEEI